MDKTTILSSHIYEATYGSYALTFGIDFPTKNVFVEDNIIRFIILDKVGQDHINYLIPSYLKNAIALDLLIIK